MMLRAGEKKSECSQTRSLLESLLEESLPPLVGRASHPLLHNSSNLYLKKFESVGTKSLVECCYKI